MRKLTIQYIFQILILISSLSFFAVYVTYFFKSSPKRNKIIIYAENLKFVKVNQDIVNIRHEAGEKVLHGSVIQDLDECTLSYYCPSQHGKPFEPDESLRSLHNVTISLPEMTNGSWSPSECRPRARLALILPVGGRQKQLPAFLYNVVRFLQQQNVSFTIFLVQQIGPSFFNKGILMNIGYEKAKAYGDFDCYIFHDVDMIPVNLCNMYVCSSKGVRHLGLSRNLTTPKYAYLSGLGGASAFTSDQFEAINGFTNIMFGWGGEDDNALQRLKHKYIPVLRGSAVIGNYLHLHHNHSRGSGRNTHKSNEAAAFMEDDGLSTLPPYESEQTEHPLYIQIIVPIKGPQTKDSALIFFSSNVNYLRAKCFKEKGFPCSYLYSNQSRNIPQAFVNHFQYDKVILRNDTQPIGYLQKLMRNVKNPSLTMSKLGINSSSVLESQNIESNNKSVLNTTSELLPLPEKVSFMDYDDFKRYLIKHGKQNNRGKTMDARKRNERNR